MTLALPLAHLHIVEFEGLGPGPLAARMLLGMGARITRVARPVTGGVAAQLGGGLDLLDQGKTTVRLNLKDPAHRTQALELVRQADGLIEGLRPGVMERLGLGPADCAAVNPRLVYGRMTGWGQHGPLAHTAGHDINYVAMSGMMALGLPDGAVPHVPPTVVGDATGALGLAFGMVCALMDAQRSGQGRVVDAAIVDVVAMLGNIGQWIAASGQIGGAVPSPFHDSPFYDSYRCADGGFITVGALEPQFYAELLTRLGLDDVPPRSQYDTTLWPALKARLAALFLSQPRDHWAGLLAGSDACAAPVLSLDEAARHPHLQARGVYERTESGSWMARVAPRFEPLA